MGLEFVTDLCISPDGHHVYASGFDDNNIVIFDRDLDDGQLHYAGQVAGDDPGFEDLETPMNMAFSQDGRDLYVGGTTGVLQLSRNPSTGQLAPVRTVLRPGDGSPAMRAAAALILSHDEAHLYAAVPTVGGVVVNSRDLVSGFLTPKSHVQSTYGLSGPVGIAADPGGEFVLVTNNDDDSLTQFLRDPHTGTLFTDRRWLGDDYEALRAPRDAAITSDGKYAYVAGYGSHAVSIFGEDEEGDWHYLGRVRNGEGTINWMRGPQSLTLSPDDKHLYVASYTDHAVIAFRRVPEDGTLTYLGAYRQGSGLIDGLTNAYHIALDPGGLDLYVAGYGSDAIAHFHRDTVGGHLNYRGRVKDGEGTDGLDGVSSVAVSPDGAYVYAAGRDDDALAIFTRDSEDGHLEFYGYAPDGAGANTGLQGARAVTVSPDGRYVYVASQVSHAVAVFAWDDESGLLRFFEAHFDGENGVDGLRTANGLALSADGRHLYVTGYDDDAVALFRTRAQTYLPIVVR
jgi:6-phosphogluconolactonase (cycloisomerase 2 family)